jgi:cobalt/nickel transport system permease protein
MHMADALLSPTVGGVMWAASGVAIAYSSRHVRDRLDESRVPLMGVAGAFVFAAQMVNFAIPGTGSSGHLGGALILAILLGPQAAFLVMASILGVQALFFADGGLLALGANVFNLGFFPAFIAYPLIYRRIVGSDPLPARSRIVTGSVIAAVVGLQLGALTVVVETTASGVTALPFATFALLMQPIHLAIGVVEGLVTAAIVIFVLRAQPELLARTANRKPLTGLRLKPVLAGLAIAALVAGAGLSWFASEKADGLEWSIARVTGSERELEGGSRVHKGAAALQDRVALLPDYALKDAQGLDAGDPVDVGAAGADDAWPSVAAGTSLSGVVGAMVTLVIAVGIGLALRWRTLARAKTRG